MTKEKTQTRMKECNNEIKIELKKKRQLCTRTGAYR
jgi:hypothetical protein